MNQECWQSFPAAEPGAFNEVDLLKRSEGSEDREAVRSQFVRDGHGKALPSQEYIFVFLLGVSGFGFGV